MAEKTFFSEGNTVVTSARVSVSGDQYFVNQISTSKIRYSVEVDKTKKFLRNLAIIGSIIIGIFLAIQVHYILGLIVAGGGITAALIFIKPNYKLHHLYLGMSSGETDAYRTTDYSYISRLSNAINEALASRA